MATIDDKKIIDDIIANNGHYMDDPQVAQIVEYTNAYGNKTWGVTWTNESKGRQGRYLIETEFVRNPKLIWMKDAFNPDHFCSNRTACINAGKCLNVVKYDRACND